MTGILVALLVIVTAALCFILGMIFGVTAANEAEKKRQLANEINMTALKKLWDINKEDK